MACAIKIMKLINEKNILAFEWSHRLTKPGLRAPLIFHEIASDGLASSFTIKTMPLRVVLLWGSWGHGGTSVLVPTAPLPHLQVPGSSWK